MSPSRRLIPTILLLAATLACALPVSYSRAQESAEDATSEETSSGDDSSESADGETEAAPSEGPFVEAMTRLSTILGSMHFLRELCGDADKGIWRTEMDALLKAQKPNETDRKRLIASFNGGYRSFQSTYRRCTPAARLAHDRYQKEAASLSRDILTRFGN